MARTLYMYPQHLNIERMLGTRHTDAAASLILGVFLNFQFNYEYHPRKSLDP